MFSLISMCMSNKILPLTSLPPWKYISKSRWISVNVLADRERAPLCSSEMPACCFLLTLAGGLIWIPTRDPQTLAVVTEMDRLFWCAQFYLSVCVCVLFPNWINWSNGRLSHPPCHAFYLSLIALSFSASICLSTFRQHLCLLPLLSSLSVQLLHKGKAQLCFLFPSHSSAQ